MKLHSMIVLVIAAIAPPAHSSEPTKIDTVAIWKDMSDCMMRGKVIQAKAAKLGGEDGVTVKIKLDKGGKVFTSSVTGAKPADFKPGSAFCAQDYVND